MASANFTTLDDSLDQASLVRGVTSGVGRPNGGGSFCLGFKSLDTAVGAAGLFCNSAGCAPYAQGAQVSAALEKLVCGGATGWSAFLFACLGGTSVTNTAYMLGISDGAPAHIVLRKGALSDGLIDATPGISGVLARSSIAIPLGQWVHLRLDVIANLNGDVLLQAFMNDLTAHTVASPTWTAIPGIANMVDDVTQIVSGSAPLVGGRSGFAVQKSDVNRVAAVDYVHLEAQTAP